MKSSTRSSPLAAATEKAVRAPRHSTAKRKSLTSAQIHERILEAISEHRLLPGMQLVEDKLAQIFNVSRTKIREATGRLVHDRIAINIPNRGAFIASPTAEEAKEVFEARRLIEPSLVAQVTKNATPAQVAQLRAHLKKESEARAGEAPYVLLTLTGDFHLMLADMAGNSFLARSMRELESLTSLIIILYDAPNGQTCPENEHEQLVDAIEAGDVKRAQQLMTHHLDHIEHSLDLSPPEAKPLSLEDVFA